MSAATDSCIKNTSSVIIYIPLLDEGTPVLRPTTGEFLSNGIYRVLPTEGYNPTDEKWQFIPGEIVKCEIKTIEGNEILVATEKLEGK